MFQLPFTAPELLKNPVSAHPMKRGVRESMKYCIVVLSMIVAGGLMAGCATTPGHVPTFRDAMIEPAELAPEGQASITARIQDEHGIVDRVEVEVAGDPDNAFELTQVEDGPTSVWTREVDVPYNVPEGEYTVRFTAYDSRGEVVVVQDETGSDQPLRATTQMRVVMPEDEGEAAPDESGE